MSAVSNKLTPASRQMSMRRVASATSLDPHALKKSVPPPNVPVPKLKTGTFNPDLPSCRYSMSAINVVHPAGGIRGYSSITLQLCCPLLDADSRRGTYADPADFPS